jgi:phosphate transport system permease protein
MFTVAAFSQPNLPNSIFSQVMALPFHLYTLATQVTNPPEDKQWGTALVLLMLVLFFAMVGTAIRTRVRLQRRE